MKKKYIIAAGIFFAVSMSAMLFNRNRVEVTGIQSENGIVSSTPLISGDESLKKHKNKIQSVINSSEHLTYSKLKREEVLAGAEDYLLADVDFDGAEDILVFNGYAGIPGAIVYSCFLNRGDSYEYCESFEEIPNPALDKDNQVIRSTTLITDFSYQWVKYAFVDNEFVMTGRLTVYAQYHSGQIIWKYNIETQTGAGSEGLVLVKTVDTSDEKDLIYADEHIYNENSVWAIDSDRWKSFYIR